MVQRNWIPAREAGRPTADLHHSLHSSKLNLPFSSPALQPNNCFSLLSDPTPAPVHHRDRPSPPNLQTSTHSIIPALNSTRHSLGTHRLLQLEAGSLLQLCTSLSSPQNTPPKLEQITLLGLPSSLHPFQAIHEDPSPTIFLPIYPVIPAESP